MPRRARVLLPGVPIHVIQRGNNRQACFFADEDYRFYLEWLREYAAKESCDVHAYAAKLGSGLAFCAKFGGFNFQVQQRDLVLGHREALDNRRVFEADG